MALSLGGVSSSFWQSSGGPAPLAMIAAMEKSVARVLAAGSNRPAALSSGMVPRSITGTEFTSKSHETSETEQ